MFGFNADSRLTLKAVVIAAMRAAAAARETAEKRIPRRSS
jgi:hypothetical protein